MIPTKIIIHHSLTEDSQTVSWSAIRKYHTEVQKWRDIGYHYGIERVGDVYEIFKGRMDNEIGAHCMGFNDDSIGICMVGDFDIKAPLPEQMALLKRLCTSLMEIHSITPAWVLGHWETYPLLGMAIQKSCPGNLFPIKEFRGQL